ncbi:DUF3040 domain-containing protein [Streptomyces vastus]
MNPGRNEERILAELERRLVHDDPALAATMATLNQQFHNEPDEPDGQPPGGHDADTAQRRRWVTAVAAFTAIAALGLLLTAVLNSNPRQNDNDTVPTRGLAPAVSVHTERRSPRRTAARRRRPGHATQGPSAAPPTAHFKEPVSGSVPAEPRPPVQGHPRRQGRVAGPGGLQPPVREGARARHPAHSRGRQ